MSKTNGSPTALANPSNDAEPTLAMERPYVVDVTIEGSTALLFHRWSDDAVTAKANAAKGSAAKKTDNVESYVWRDNENRICLPGDYVRGAVCGPAGAAKFRQDPRSPRKSALDLYKASVVALTDLAPVLVGDKHKETTTWEYLDRRRVTVQRAGVTRVRPAFMVGWRAHVSLQVLMPHYVPPSDLLSVLTDAGRLVGVGDYRPTFGRFQIVSYDVGVA